MLSERIKEYAFLLLKYRLRSEKELYQRLKKKKFSEEEIRQLISFLKKKNFLDDKVFTKAWITSRLNRSFGLRRISQELKIKGVSTDLLEENIRLVKNNYCEAKVVEELAKERLGRLKGIEPTRARNRTYAFLIRRGFSPETIADTLNKICKQTY
ncbi:MAG: regulatory protein RecX [Candidatus Omnitrophica bacterium]|nr:regulatory protein RecX [Candidatus Omnitrophota bacterium]